MNLEQITKISIEQLKKLGLEVPEDKIDFEEIDIYEHLNNQFQEALTGVAIEEFDQLIKESELEIEKIHKMGIRSFGTKEKYLDNNGDIRYKITIIKGEGLPDFKGDYNEVRAIGIIAHELAHVWMSENTQNGKLSKQYGDINLKLNKNIKDSIKLVKKLEFEFRNIHMHDTDYVFNPRIKKYCKEFQDKIIEQEESILTEKKLKQIKKTYSLQNLANSMSLLNDAGFAETMNKLSDMCDDFDEEDLVSKYATPSLLNELGYDSKRFKERKAKEKQEKQEKLKTTNKRFAKKNDLYNRINSLYSHIEKTAERALQSIETYKQFTSTCKILSEGWAEYVAQEVQKNYRSETGKENLIMNNKELKVELLKAKSEYEKAIKETNDDQKKQLYRIQLSNIDFELTMMGIKQDSSYAFRREYVDGLDIFNSFETFEKAKTSAMKCKNDRELMIRAGYKVPERAKPIDNPAHKKKGIIGYISGFFKGK